MPISNRHSCDLFSTLVLTDFFCLLRAFAALSLERLEGSVSSQRDPSVNSFSFNNCVGGTRFCSVWISCLFRPVAFTWSVTGDVPVLIDGDIPKKHSAQALQRLRASTLRITYLQALSFASVSGGKV